MSESSSPPVAAKSVPLQPNFMRAWGAIWLFTWKSQLTWRKMRTLSILLLVVPFLVWKTTDSPKTWGQRDNELPLGNYASQMEQISRRTMRTGSPLDTNQTAQLRQIFSDEYEQTQKAFRNIPSPETSIDQQRELIDNCYQHILDKAKPVLNTRQFDQLDSLEKQLSNTAEGRIGDNRWNRTAPFYHWIIDFYFFIILPFSCVWASGGLIRDELQSDTLGFLTTRPVKRATLVLLKWLAQVTWLEIVVMVEGLLICGAGVVREIPGLGTLIPLFIAVQILAVPAWCALGLFLGQLTKRYLPLALVYGLVVELGIGDIPTNINTLSLMRHLKVLLGHDQNLQSLFEWSGTGVFVPIGALLLACALFVGLSAFLFTFREYHANTEMQK